MTVEVCTSMVLLDEEGCEYDADVVLIVSIDYFHCQPADSGADNPDDFHGYTEMDYTIDEVYIDDGEFKTKVPFTQEQFNNPKDVDRIEQAIIESYED